MSAMKEQLDNISWDALRTGEIIIDGTTYAVWGEEELRESLDEALESYGEFKIGEMTFYPGQIVRECDPIVWQIMMQEHAAILTDNDILVYGENLTDYIMDAEDFVETLNTSYTVKAA